MTTATAEKPQVKDPLALHATTQGLVKKMEDLVSIDPKTGVVTFVADAYERLLPADIPLATAKALHIHEGHLMAAAVEAVGNLSRETAGKHKALDSTKAELEMVNRNRLEVTWNRSEERNAGIAEKGQVAPKKTVYGTMTAKHVVAGAATSSGEINKVAKRQKAFALEMFGTAEAK